MASKYSSGLLLTILILLVALDYSSAKCYQGHIGERKDESEPKFLWGRKLLQEMKGNSIDIQGKSKPFDNVFPTPQMENDHIQAQKKNEGSMEFGESADEVATLMRRDYKGQGRGRRKPPINNHEPNN